jgi:hypothetical protein
MAAQSVTILIVLTYVNYYDDLIRLGWHTWATPARDVCIWLTISITVVSGLLYIRRAIAMYRAKALTP